MKKTKKPRRDKYEAAGPKIARYKSYHKNRMTNHWGSNMVYTEAQSLEEAVDLLLQKKSKNKRPINRKNLVSARDEALGYKPKGKITLPRLKFLEHGENDERPFTRNNERR